MSRSETPNNRRRYWPKNPEPLSRSGFHPSFADFPSYSGPKPQGCVIEWDGSLFTPECLQRNVPENELMAQQQVQIPQQAELHEELFEWVDIFEAVRDARGSFVFIELGAGHGRWSIRAFHAATKWGLTPNTIQLLTVEPDRLHNS